MSDCRIAVQSISIQQTARDRPLLFFIIGSICEIKCQFDPKIHSLIIEFVVTEFIITECSLLPIFTVYQLLPFTFNFRFRNVFDVLNYFKIFLILSKHRTKAWRLNNTSFIVTMKIFSFPLQIYVAIVFSYQLKPSRAFPSAVARSPSHHICWRLFVKARKFDSYVVYYSYLSNCLAFWYRHQN
jgi:hypothetical protein